jgi:hypothetical protein
MIRETGLTTQVASSLVDKLIRSECRVTGSKRNGNKIIITIRQSNYYESKTNNQKCVYITVVPKSFKFSLLSSTDSVILDHAV